MHFPHPHLEQYEFWIENCILYLLKTPSKVSFAQRMQDLVSVSAAWLPHVVGHIHSNFLIADSVFSYLNTFHPFSPWTCFLKTSFSVRKKEQLQETGYSRSNLTWPLERKSEVGLVKFQKVKSAFISVHNLSYCRCVKVSYQTECCLHLADWHN